MEYVFCDTDKELPETYEYLKKIEYTLGIKIEKLRDDRSFDHWLAVYGGHLPSSNMRWCTKMLKIRPVEKYVGDDDVMMYVGIRADEDRAAYISTKPNIKTVLPFKEAGFTIDDVHRVLDESGVGLPGYYDWRTRSGCYFCFFQRRAEWVGLADRHPELFERAVNIERKVLMAAGADGDADFTQTAMQDRQYTWSGNETLPELLERREEILVRH